MKYIIRLMPEREKFLPEIKEQIPNLIIVRDKTRNAMDTFLDALEAAGEDAAVHLEDDIILTNNFKKKIERVIADHKNEVVQFFSRRKKDLEVGSRYEPGSSFIYGQCFYLPDGYSKMIREYYPSWERKEEHPTGLDYMVADFLKSRKERYFLHVPSLVDHRAVTSLIDSRRSRFRQSKTFKKE